MKRLNFKSLSRVILVVVFVAIFAISGVAYLIASHADSNCSGASTKTTRGVTSPTVNCSQNTQPIITQTSVTSAQPANINHPTTTDCQPNGKRFTVYAAKVAGTPAYSYSGNSVLRLVPFRAAIESVYCNDNSTLLYHFDGNGVYSTYQLKDVSTTQP